MAEPRGDRIRSLSWAYNEGGRQWGSMGVGGWLWSPYTAYSFASTGASANCLLQCTHWGVMSALKRDFYTGATTAGGVGDDVGDCWLRFVS